MSDHKPLVTEPDDSLKVADRLDRLDREAYDLEYMARELRWEAECLRREYGNKSNISQ